MKTKILLGTATVCSILFFSQCGNDASGDDANLKTRVDSFLTAYNNKYRDLNIVSNEAQWTLLTHIVPGDTVTSAAADKAAKDLAAYQGSADVIKLTQEFLGKKDKLDSLEVEQLQHILYFAGGSPQTIKDIVDKRIAAETEAGKKLYGFNYILNGDTITTNDIDNILVTEMDTNKRLAAWECSKTVGKDLHKPLEELRQLRNQVVQGLNYPDFFSYQVADYGMSADTMMTLLRGINDDIYPLYRELHTWARYELAKKYHSKTVPDYLPAQWLPNRWGQDWSDLVTVHGVDLDSIINARKYNAEWVVQDAERYYVSMGFPELPKTFWDKSSLYPVPPGANYKKNNHASAWHMDYDQDVRSLMSVEPNAHWYETTHHELGHIYYYLSYSKPGIPYILREGANRAYHEALGTMFGMAAMQQPFLVGMGLVDPKAPVDTVQMLMKEALRYIVALNWQAGTMSEFEYELYAKNLPADQFNKRWWEIVKREQGIVPPEERGEEYCDAATKTHIIDDPGQYYDYALATVLQFQFHCYIAKNILHQNPAFTNYYGNKEIGKFIGDMMSKGGVGDWRTLLKEKTGSDLTAKPMLEYFAPLLSYLKKVNAGRKYTLPEQRQH
ncbi:MAG TPA: M2 family metallopeptidase [Bacteroidia bacterium]|jgi:peptidyl-dipeptidase A|nr:M2 family metallopeptidase [Bacteroidia bacterium]